MNKINYDARKAIYEEALKTYGEKKQLMMVIEEMSEMTQVICKLLRTPGDEDPKPATIARLVDECTDVTIMMEQLRLILDINDKVCSRMDFKVARLANRLHADVPKTEEEP